MYMRGSLTFRLRGMKRLLALILFSFFLVFSAPQSHAQLSQLEFDEPDVDVKALEEKIPPSSDLPSSIEEAERAEREAMELLLKQKNEKNTPAPVVEEEVLEPIIGNADFKGLEIPLDKVAREYRALPPRVKGPFTDDKTEHLITSQITWKSNSKGDCGKAANEAEYFKKALSLSMLLEKFSGTSDYYELLNAEVCQPRCDLEKEVPEISYMRLSSGSTSRLIIPLMESNCRFQLEKDTNTRWMMMKVKSITCSCFSKKVASLRGSIKALVK